jgi:hypothetical protein
MEHDPRRPRGGGQPHPAATSMRASHEAQRQREEMALSAVAAQTMRDHAIADAANAFTVLVDAAVGFLRSHEKAQVQIEPCGIEGRVEHVREGAEPFCANPRGHAGPHSWEPRNPDYDWGPAAS